MDKEKPQIPGPSRSNLAKDYEDPSILPSAVSDLKGYHPKSGITLATKNRNKKFKLCPFMNPKLCSEENRSKLKEAWTKATGTSMNDLELIKDPFTVCIIDNFLENIEYNEGIRNEFDEVDWHRQKMDLYEFFKSDDLKYHESGYIKGFFEFLQNSVMKWVSEITGFELTKISVNCSCYTNTDFLAVHDDHMGDRMVAFVYYLTGPKGWDSSKGGCLDLFSKDEIGHPDKVVKSIMPKNNQFVFFPVTNDSYHQVAEVTTLEDTRLTINGWFHVKTAPIFQMPKFVYPENTLFGNRDLQSEDNDLVLESWIRDTYLQKQVTDDIQRSIEEESEISLDNFFNDEIYNEVEEALKTIAENGNIWKILVPPNRSRYEVLCTENGLYIPKPLESYLRFFQSSQFFEYLKTITEMEFKSMKFELQKWTPGSYCLLSPDHDWNKKELDVLMYFPCGGQDIEEYLVGGRVQYVDMEEEFQEALITVEPETNRLNLVYRDTARFTSYFSKQSMCKQFFLLICTYSE